ncbi:hypothetical protein CC77DRAFT_1010222 [Alternaria alternata]|uniref:Rhodopsin domain-containing protein n=1 Tax=Alternaria alternata TaxID=5599 RepID=A0A177DIH1_ALTAL|nr:hypothetical protein CC77DRAFT_1010222 [Alternaria alternata]OAG19000.1 hypothetical protein CC77DRAFT_1010222 [Alternaria alternata]
MSTSTALLPDPAQHPDNANLPNVNEPETILGLTIAFLSVAIFTLSLRLWFRIKDRLWGWDDLFVVLAAAASFIGDIMVCMMPVDGLGLHLWTLDAEHLTSYFKHIYSTNAAYTASTALIKLSILIQYLRLFAEAAPSATHAQYRLARCITWAMIVICSLWGLTFFFLALFPCNPIAKNWNPTLDGTCIGWGSKNPQDFFHMFLGHAVSNCLLDILVLLLPVPFVTTLRIAGKSRAGLVGLFSLGCVVVIVAIGRMIAMSVNKAGTEPVLDMSFHTPIVYIFAVLEVNFAIITASIPIFWPAIATLASNKIFVVNEVQIHVEHVTRNDSFDSNAGGISLSDRKITSSGGDSKMGVITTISDQMPRKSGEKSSPINHYHKSSNASSIGPTLGGFGGRKASTASSVGRTMGMDLAGRPSQDSLRHLYRIPSNENRSSKSLTQSEGDDWFMEMDRANSRGQVTTTVQKTSIPFEHIKTSDNK